MKKETLLLAFFLFALYSVSYAQFLSEIQTRLGATYPHTLVQEDRSGRYVYVCAYNGKQYEILRVDAQSYMASIITAMPVDKILLPTDITYISDMDISSQMLSFCGRHRDGCGLIGGILFPWYSPVSVTYYKVPETTNVRKVISYLESTPTIRTIAIGESNDCPTILIENADTWGYSFTYKYAKVYGERLDEIFSDRYNNTVFVGEKLSDKSLAMRKSIPNNVLSNPAINTLYHYPSTVGQVLSLTKSDMHMGSSIATAYYSNSTTSDMVTRIDYVNLTNMLMYNSQKFQVEKMATPLKLIYIPWSGKPVLLQAFNSSPNSFDYMFITLEPSFTTTYSAKTLYHHGSVFYNMCRFDLTCFVAIGDGEIYFQDNVSPFASNDACIQNTPTDIHPNTTIPVVQQYLSITPIPRSYSQTVVDLATREYLQFYCINSQIE